MAPRRLTELFFLDEATGLAAGHRPCGECRIPEYRAFRDAWTVAHGGPEARAPEARAPEIDRRMHEDRLSSPGIKRVYRERLDALPEATMVESDRKPWLLLGGQLLAWGPGGYGERRDRPQREEVTVLTPRSTVAVLRAGYLPVLHESARS
jgi:hypothetical protein